MELGSQTVVYNDDSFARQKHKCIKENTQYLLDSVEDRLE
jgi:hypothetical protein